MRKLVLALSAATMVAPVMPIAATADAAPRDYQGDHGRTWHGRDGRT